MRLSTSTIDDLGNVNVNTHIKLENFAQTSFTIRLLPTIYFPGGSGGGDPHFQRWGQRRESFHGECDLVVLHSADFHQEGLDFHVRTTMASQYSYIESAAVRLGIDKVEVRNGSIVFNGNRFNDNELPITFGGNMYSYTFYLHKAVRSAHNEVIRRTYRLTLDDSSEIEFRFYKHYLTFTINGHPDFDGSRGILGAFPSGEMLGREDNLIESFTDFGFEWQVRVDDLTIFADQREPQLPYEMCRLPTAPRPSRRALRGNQALLSGAESVFESFWKRFHLVCGRCFDYRRFGHG